MRKKKSKKNPVQTRCGPEAGRHEAQAEEPNGPREEAAREKEARPRATAQPARKTSVWPGLPPGYLDRGR